MEEKSKETFGSLEVMDSLKESKPTDSPSFNIMQRISQVDKENNFELEDMQSPKSETELENMEREIEDIKISLLNLLDKQAVILQNGEDSKKPEKMEELEIKIMR